jgi:hypothetical protein
MAFVDVDPFAYPNFDWHDWNDAVSVQFGELVDAGWIDIYDKTVWSWPQYSDAQDKTLRDKISNRFWNREIGILPPKLWRRQFIERMNEIMPRMIPLYRVLNESPQLLGAESEYYKSRNIFSDFPQTQLGGNSDYGSTGNDTEYERIKQLDTLDLERRLREYRDVDEIILEDLDGMFSCLVSVSFNAR